MPADVTEIKGQFNDVFIVTELRGSIPDVPFFDDVDIAELTKNDPDPMYLTIGIGKANVISSNKRFYDEAWLQELERQVKSNRPIGIMGHLSEEDLSTKFPEEAIFWLGVRRVGEMLLGKGYIPAGAARERMRKYKAANKAIGTSIFATAEGVWNAARGAYDMIAETLKLQQIDIGPADRIGVAALASVPFLTAEMAAEAAIIKNKEPIMAEKGKLEYINEMTADDARLLPTPVREAILATVQQPAEVATVANIRETLGLAAGADVVATITEMRQAQVTAAKQLVTSRITELVNEGIKVETVRPVVLELVTARQPATVDAAEAAYTQVVEMDSVKNLLAAHVIKTMGPPQRTKVQGKQARYFQIPASE